MVASIFIVPRIWGGVPLVVTTGSMAPAIRPGDLIITRPIHPTALRLGDVITFATTEAIITHRVIGTANHQGNPALITRGDANGAPDAPIVFEQVRGKVIFRIPRLGLFSNYLRTHWWVIPLAGAGLWGGLALAELKVKPCKA